MSEIKPSKPLQPRITHPEGWGLCKWLLLDSITEQECVMHGPLAITLFVCRFFGLSPLSFTKRPSGWIVRVSPGFCIYTHFLITLLVTGTVVGVGIDSCIEPKRAVRMRTSTSSVAWICEVSIVVASVVVGGYGSPRRMVAMVEYLNLLRKVNSKFPSAPSDKKGVLLASAWLTVAAVMYWIDFYTKMLETIDEDRYLPVMYLYSFCYMKFVMVVVMPMQFVFTGFIIESHFKLINGALQDIVHEKERAPNSMKPAHISVRRLAVYFGTVCDVVSTVDGSNSLMLLMLLGVSFLRLVVTPYYFVTFLISPKAKVTDCLLLHISFCFLHVFSLKMLVEPGHRTELEIEHTKNLVSHLLRHVSSPTDPLAEELDYFCQLLSLNKVCYSAEGLCNLSRPLIAMMFNGVTTYLVIILQFQSLDKTKV